MNEFNHSMLSQRHHDLGATRRRNAKQPRALAAVFVSTLLLTLGLGSANLVHSEPGDSLNKMDQRCERLRLRTAASIAKCRLRAMANAVGKGEPDFAACEQRFDNLLGRVVKRSNGHCGNEDDRQSIGGRTDDATSVIRDTIGQRPHFVGCDDVNCPSGSECRTLKLEVPTCIDTCAQVRCPSGTRCELTPGICPAVLGIPCPPIAQCVPDRPCAEAGCEPWQECRVVESTGEPYCADTCRKCRGQGRCEILETPCPGPDVPCPPVVECVDDDPCALALCEENQICRPAPNGQAICIDTCRGVECDEGERCTLVDVTCVTEPCFPVAECVPTATCANTACRPHQECRIHERSGQPFCADTCSDFECPDGFQCELEDVVCVTEPCPARARCVADPAETCSLGPDAGDCNAAFQRWFHNPRSQTCQPFTWGGCGGNSNNFTSERECLRRCPPAGDTCVLPPDPGPCDAAIARVYFDASSGTCKRFSWGGCEGNANKFESFEECARACQSQTEDNQ